MSYNQEFANDVRLGLLKSLKKIPSKWKYDKEGDELFVKLMSIPEYYVSRAEMSIFEHRTDHLISALQMNKDIDNKDTSTIYDILELGAGDGTKTYHLLKRLLDLNIQFEYHPGDISQNALDMLEEMLVSNLPSFKIRKHQGQYIDIMKKFKETNQSMFESNPKNGAKRETIVLVLGSNIGNMPEMEAKNFLSDIQACFCDGGVLLLGVDLMKSSSIILPAYNDSEGKTKAFNLHLLSRINRELGGNFDVEKFLFEPRYDSGLGEVNIYLKSNIDQAVHIKAINKTIQFKAGELIQTEYSRKYSDEKIQKLLDGTNFKVIDKMIDSEEYFADYIFEYSCCS